MRLDNVQDSLRRVQCEHLQKDHLDLEPEEILEMSGGISTHDYMYHANSDYADLVNKLVAQSSNSWSTYNYDKYQSFSNGIMS